jgi:hypothetical protein
MLMKIKEAERRCQVSGVGCQVGDLGLGTEGSDRDSAGAVHNPSVRRASDVEKNGITQNTKMKG